MLTANRQRTWLARRRRANFDEQNPNESRPRCSTRRTQAGRRRLYGSATAASMQALRDMSARKNGVMKNGKQRPNGAEHRLMRVDEAECGSLPMTETRDRKTRCGVCTSLHSHEN
ncbi:hypothetical protein HPB52_023556 [Rhipicephalus sanguineus]|uniref:Uncharacterized protein n=1 Tax=Rhipicephalus sanguineus TaxID=34632 RepID=A0A9D4PII8_RHISA|nr:hypothetical protein HPB52_023556 [Rhipicephalus sanguineus]